ncbi:hypothetical protein CFP56_014867 [Quercus suber]|uniref:Uncharacterized protein n=1 Tax=Quercus suber TaxID=58331 RepID=A0AAW0KQX1_QUESU
MLRKFALYSNSYVVRQMRGTGRGGEVRDAWKVPVRKFRVRRVVVPRVYTYKTKTRSFQPHHHNQASEQDFISSAPIHVIINFIIQSLIGLIQVEYQSKSLSPFHAHPISMRTFFAAISIYSMGLATKMELQTRSICYSKILSHVILISGVLSSASLASTLLPHLLIISMAFWRRQNFLYYYQNKRIRSSCSKDVTKDMKVVVGV